MSAKPPFEHESAGVNARRIVKFGVGLFAVLALALMVLYFVTMKGVFSNHASVVDRPGVAPSSPHLQPHPDADIAALRRQTQQALSTWAWTDPAHTHARIPIKRAMQLYARHHTESANASSHPTGGAR